jgi:hypothetical protein
LRSPREVTDATAVGPAGQGRLPSLRLDDAPSGELIAARPPLTAGQHYLARNRGGTEDAPTHSVGTDFGIVGKDGRFESITGFVDVGPGAPSKS